MIFESGKSLQQMLERCDIHLSQSTEVYVPRDDKELDYMGYRVGGNSDLAGFVSLEKKLSRPSDRDTTFSPPD
jgi:hypothetical protein